MGSWYQIEETRKELGLSRAEMCRRAGISESTVFKGMKRCSAPSNAVRTVIEQVFSHHKFKMARSEQLAPQQAVRT